MKKQEKSHTEDGVWVELSPGKRVFLAQHVASLNRSAWKKVVPANNFFLSYKFLEAFEKTAAPNVSFYYAVAYDGENPFAAFYFQVIRLTADEIVGLLRPALSEVTLGISGDSFSAMVRKWREEKGMRILVSGNNFISGEYGVGYLPETDPAKVYEALCRTVKVITDTDRLPAKISAILVKDYFLDSAKSTSDCIRGNRYHRFLVEPEMIVHLEKEWKSFDDYLGSMTKKYRNRAKSVLKKSEKLEEVELDAEMVKKVEAQLYPLYRNVHTHAKFRLAALGENYFSVMKTLFPSRFRISGYLLNGKWVAFRSSFTMDKHLEAHFIGIDYSVNREYHLYQRVLYDFVKEGIEKKLPAVYLGRTAAEMKSTVGAVPHDLVCYIRHRNGISNQVIRPFIDYLRPSEWVQRNPFKE